MQVICENFEKCLGVRVNPSSFSGESECWHISPHDYDDKQCHGFCDEHGETKCMEITLTEINGGKNDIQGSQG